MQIATAALINSAREFSIVERYFKATDISFLSVGHG
jgi:uridine phosphorylase